MRLCVSAYVHVIVTMLLSPPYLQLIGEHVKHSIPANLKEQKSMMMMICPLTYQYLNAQVCKTQTVCPFPKSDVHFSVELSVERNRVAMQ